MNFTDTLLTATQNLLTRKWRTVLNLIGVVVACTMLIMTLAGTRGVADGIQSMISALDGVSRFVVRPGWNINNEPPPEAYQVEGEMSDARRERIQERLKNAWLSEFGEYDRLTRQIVDELAQIDHIVELIPNFNLGCEVNVEGSSVQNLDGLPARTSSVSVADKSLERDIVAGRRLDHNDLDGVIVDEVFAYRLGFRSDKELDSMIGKTLTMHFENTGLRDDSFYFLRALGDSAGADFAEQAQLLTAIRALVDDIDNTKLTKEQKKKIRAAFKNFSSTPNGTRGTDQSDTSQASSKQRFMTRKLVVRGVIREAKREGIENLLRLARGHSTSAILIHPGLADEISEELKRNRVSRAIGTASSIDHLEDVVTAIKAEGYEVSSVANTIGRINKHINRILIGLSVLAGIILLVAAMTISNTLTISVIERTPEFGVMKAMGARDHDILAMMLCEGAVTGIIGAAIATLVSLGLANVISYFVRDYVEGQIGSVFSADIFKFSVMDGLTALTIGCIVCTLASVLPAMRAARLDPIVAMRRK